MTVRKAVIGEVAGVDPGRRPVAPATESFEVVFRRESVRMIRLAYLMVGSAPLAEEVVQDAFARLLERWEGIEQPAAYLRTCVLNGCRNAHRRRALERKHAARPAVPVAGVLGADHLQDALAELPVKRRAAIILRYYHDLSEAEIADTLGVRPGTVKSLVSRGLAQLREVLEP
jgi:RNA polymerase sigma-70 factor (sigma-E family)